MFACHISIKNFVKLHIQGHHQKMSSPQWVFACVFSEKNLSKMQLHRFIHFRTKWFLSTVCLHLAFQVRSFRKYRPQKPHKEMVSLQGVFFKGGALRKWSYTNFTRKWFLSSVCSHVAFQARSFRKCRSTNFTRKWLLSRTSSWRPARPATRHQMVFQRWKSHHWCFHCACGIWPGN